MNWDTVEGSWKEMLGKAKSQWGKITGDDWAQISGKREEIAGLIQKRYGQTKEAAEREVDAWFRSL